MNNQNVYILEDRGILYINGADTKEFLQNLILMILIKLLKPIAVSLLY